MYSTHRPALHQVFAQYSPMQPPAVQVLQAARLTWDQCIILHACVVFNVHDGVCSVCLLAVLLPWQVLCCNALYLLKQKHTTGLSLLMVVCYERYAHT